MSKITNDGLTVGVKGLINQSINESVQFVTCALPGTELKSEA